MLFKFNEDRLVAYLLVFPGSVRAHNFYLKRTGVAVARSSRRSPSWAGHQPRLGARRRIPHSGLGQKPELLAAQLGA
jgi:hypothetical protein